MGVCLVGERVRESNEVISNLCIELCCVLGFSFLLHLVVRFSWETNREWRETSCCTKNERGVFGLSQWGQTQIVSRNFTCMFTF